MFGAKKQYLRSIITGNKISTVIVLIGKQNKYLNNAPSTILE